MSENCQQSQKIPIVTSNRFYCLKIVASHEKNESNRKLRQSESKKVTKHQNIKTICINKGEKPSLKPQVRHSRGHARDPL